MRYSEARKDKMNKAVFTAKLCDLLRELLGQLVMRPSDLRLESDTVTNTLTVSVSCHAEDAPRIIGKAGSHHKALLRIARAIGERERLRVYVEVSAPRMTHQQIERREHWGFEPDPNWPRKGITRLLAQTCRMVFGDCMELESTDDEGQNKTMFAVSVSAHEPLELVLAMVSDLNTLFNAIGKRNGRLLQIDVTPKLEPEKKQPKSAAGRFAREVER